VSPSVERKSSIDAVTATLAGKPPIYVIGKMATETPSSWQSIRLFLAT